MEVNGVNNAKLFQAAVGDRDGSVNFRVDPGMPLNGKIDRGQVHSSAIVRKVPMVTLDTVIGQRPDPIAVLKIDVEGAEPLVLRGASRTLANGGVRTILFEFIVEFIEDMGENPYQYIRTILDLGFKLYRIEADGSQTEIFDDVSKIVDSRRVTPEAKPRPFQEINLVAKHCRQ
jgi:FkbM family methyltransferase